MTKTCMVRKKSKSLRISRTTLVKALVRWEKIENSNETSFWSFQGRLPCKDKVIVDALRTLIENFWHENTRASPNQKDVIKRRIWKTNREPHAKHFLDMTQTQFYEMFLQRFPQLKSAKGFLRCQNHSMLR